MPDKSTDSTSHGPLPDPRDYVSDGMILIGASKSGRDIVPETI